MYWPISGVTRPCSARNSATRQLTRSSSSRDWARVGTKMSGSYFHDHPPST